MAKPASTASLAAVGGVVRDAMTPRRRRGSEDRDSRKPQPSAQVRGCVVALQPPAARHRQQLGRDHGLGDLHTLPLTLSRRVFPPPEGRAGELVHGAPEGRAGVLRRPDGGIFCPQFMALVCTA